MDPHSSSENVESNTPLPAGFEQASIRQVLQRIRAGLRAPRDSGAYRYARLQLSRLSAPVCAVLLPILVVGIICIIPTPFKDGRLAVTTTLGDEPEPPPPLDDVPAPEPLPIPAITQPSVEIDGPPVPDLQPPVAVANPTRSAFTPKPNPVPAVDKTISPVMLPGIFSGRTTGAIGEARDAGGGSDATENAVLRALRWLKHNQEPDGSWQGSKSTSAMTGLAALAYLAHGDQPGTGEFGDAVERALRCLVTRQQSDGTFSPRDPHNYTHPICTYALVEAFGMTRNPQLRDPARQAVDRILEGQHPSGGWDYNLKQSSRDDCSYMGWCVQALKAARIADLYGSDETMHTRLEQALHRAGVAFQKLFVAQGDAGFFAYTAQSHHRLAGDPSLTGVGTLALQLLGQTDARETRAGMRTIAGCNWNQWSETDWRRIYFRYYDTQVAFQQGGAMWKQWNPMFQQILLKNQTVQKSVIRDAAGVLQDIGHWTTHADQEGLVYNTCLCTLMLEVYHRHLPTYRPPRQEQDTASAHDDDIPILIAGINMQGV